MNLFVLYIWSIKGYNRTMPIDWCLGVTHSSWLLCETSQTTYTYKQNSETSPIELFKTLVYWNQQSMLFTVTLNVKTHTRVYAAPPRQTIFFIIINTLLRTVFGKRICHSFLFKFAVIFFHSFFLSSSFRFGISEEPRKKNLVVDMKHWTTKHVLNAGIYTIFVSAS